MSELGNKGEGVGVVTNNCRCSSLHRSSSSLFFCFFSRAVANDVDNTMKCSATCHSVQSMLTGAAVSVDVPISVDPHTVLNCVQVAREWGGGTLHSNDAKA